MLWLHNRGLREPLSYQLLEDNYSQPDIVEKVSLECFRYLEMSADVARLTWVGRRLFHPRQRSWTKHEHEGWSGKHSANDKRVRPGFRHGGAALAKLDASDSSCAGYSESRSLA